MKSPSKRQPIRLVTSTEFYRCETAVLPPPTEDVGVALMCFAASHRPKTGVTDTGFENLSSGTLFSSLERAQTILKALEPEQRKLETRFGELKTRLHEGRFHLAVLGQFKRGKSTFLNALLGEEILPSSVIPLTAIPTFISSENDCRGKIVFSDDTPRWKSSRQQSLK